MSEIRSRRRYHSPQRREQAQLTREKIIKAARRLFGAQGYTATTLPDVAREAGVSAPTITAVFGTKASLLEALINSVLRDDAAAASLARQAWWQEMLAEPDPRRQLQLHAASARRVHELGADVYEIVRGAATADPDFAAIMQQRHARLYGDMRTFADALTAKGALRPDITPEQAADLLWALSGPEMYRLLTVERGWSPEAFERWLASTLIHSLLGG